MPQPKEHLPQCPVCLSREVGFRCHHRDFSGVEIWYCPACQHGFAYPEPDGLKLENYYKNVYRVERKKYLGEEYYVLMERRAQAQLRFIEHGLAGEGPRRGWQGWQVMDWGCGVGALVALFQQNGAAVLGFDSDPEVIATGRRRWGANIAVGSTAALQRSQGRFHLLLLSHVVEHLPDLRQTLTGLLKVLQPGGLVFIEVPDCQDETFAPLMDPESHLHFFTSQSLRLLLEGLGLQVLSCVSCGPPPKSASRQEQAPTWARFFTRVAQRLAKLRPDRPLPDGNSKEVKTIYDGFYEYYPPAANGLWLRCLSRL